MVRSMAHPATALQTRSRRIAIGVIAMWLTRPRPQVPGYHDFADTRVLWDIPHVGDVVTNLAFIVVGGWGLWFLMRPRLSGQSFIDSRERWPFRWFFASVLLIGFGSGWYHLEPDNVRLVWDRLPIAVAFMSIFAIVIAERVKLSVGLVLLGPLGAMGAASVLWWIWTEIEGQGDLRWYLMVQLYPLLTITLLLLLLPTRYTRGNRYWGVLLCYALAKVGEYLDHEIYDVAQGVVSGHNLKHLCAAAGAAWLLRMLWLRRAGPAGPGVGRAE